MCNLFLCCIIYIYKGYENYLYDTISDTRYAEYPALLIANAL